MIYRYLSIVKLSFPHKKGVERERHWVNQLEITKGYKQNSSTCRIIEIEKRDFTKQLEEMNNNGCNLHEIERLKQAYILYYINYIARHTIFNYMKRHRLSQADFQEKVVDSCIFHNQAPTPRVRFSICIPRAATLQQQEEQYEAQANHPKDDEDSKNL